MKRILLSACASENRSSSLAIATWSVSSTGLTASQPTAEAAKSIGGGVIHNTYILNTNQPRAALCLSRQPHSIYSQGKL